MYYEQAVSVTEEAGRMGVREESVPGIAGSTLCVS